MALYLSPSTLPVNENLPLELGLRPCLLASAKVLVPESLLQLSQTVSAPH